MNLIVKNEINLSEVFILPRARYLREMYAYVYEKN